MPNKYLDSVGLAEYTTLIKTALDDKADLSSPALTGTPTAPTPTAGDDSTKIATTEFVQDAIDSEETRADGAYLPLTGGSVTGNLSVSGTITGNVTGNVTGTASGNLSLSGGTMTGTLYFDTGTEARIQNNTSNNDAWVGIYGGQGYSNGAYLILNGKDRSTNAGYFSIYANDGNSLKYLQGRPDGTLRWNGSITADEFNGNATKDGNGNVITSTYLPLSGGTLTGALALTNIKSTANTNRVSIVGGTDETSAYLNLYGKTHASYAGQFSLTAYDGTNRRSLAGKPDGTLTWSGKELERVHAYSISASTGYVRYTSGLQIVWGDVGSVGTTAVEETYAVAFSAYPSVVATANSNATIYINANNSTRFTVRTASGTTTVRYIAIGKWQ